MKLDNILCICGEISLIINLFFIYLSNNQNDIFYVYISTSWIYWFQRVLSLIGHIKENENGVGVCVPTRMGIGGKVNTNSMAEYFCITDVKFSLLARQTSSN